MKILVTGAAGMIGSALVSGLADAGYEVIGVDRREGNDERVDYAVLDLADKDALSKLVSASGADRIIHLAALAHTAGESDLSYDRYYHVNVECARNVFEAAGERPVLFISTVDVFGFTKGTVTVDTEPKPVTAYGKTKALAEAECKSICKGYTIFRLSPVYTPSVKRDVQKRYYLKYPSWAYIIGKGAEYEVLNIELAVSKMVEWCATDADNRIHIIKDDAPLNTAEYITRERAEGRARRVLRVPRWLAVFGFAVLRALTGRNKYTYLLNKAVYPLRTE